MTRVARSFTPRFRQGRIAVGVGNGSRSSFRPRLEVLEDRTVPSALIWTNRGQASDNFSSVFGSNAAAARLVVDAAISSWQRVLTNLHQNFGGNQINLQISMDTTGTGFGAEAGVTGLDAVVFGKPTSGNITIKRGNDTNGDGIGDGAGWFLDPSPLDNSEFAGNIVNAFAGDAQAGSPAEGLRDLFTVALLELTHIMGQTGGAVQFQLPANGSTLTNTNIHDDSEGGGTGFYWVFDGPSVTHLMTSDNLGPAPKGSDFGEPIHTAGPPGAIQPITFGSAFRGSRRLFGADDSGNALFEGGRRYLVSDVVALMLKDAYGYSIVRPQSFATFYAILNQTTGNLLVRGGADNSNDTITLSRSGTDLLVSVDVGNDIPGTGPNGDASNLPAFVTRIPFSSVNSITIQPGAGNDVVTLNVTGGNVFPSGGISFDGGLGTDRISATGASSYFLKNDSLSLTGFGTVSLTSVERAALTGTAGNDTFDVSRWTSIATISGGSGTDTIISEGRQGNQTLTNTSLAAGGGTFTLSSIEVANLSGNIDDNTFFVGGWTGTGTINGGIGSDLIDAVGDVNYSLSSASLSRTGRGTLNLISIERANLRGGAGINAFLVSDWTGTATLNGLGSGDSYTVNARDPIFGTTTVNISDTGASGADLVTVNLLDTADTCAVTSSVVSAIPLTVNYSGIESLIVDGRGGSDNIAVFSTAATTPVTIRGGTGADSLTVQQSLQFDATLFRVVGTIQAPVTIDGSVDTDIDTLDVTYLGSFTSNLVHVTAASVDDSLIPYQNIDQLIVDTGVGGDSITVFSTAFRTSTFIRGGADNDVISVGGTGVGGVGTVAGIAGPLQIDGGAGINTLLIDNSGDTVGRGAGQVVNNSLVVGLGNPLPINYFFMATLRVLLGSGADNFNASSSLIPVILEGNGGNDTLIGGADADTLRGGDNDDVLIGGPGIDILDGGPGTDIAQDTGTNTFISIEGIDIRGTDQADQITIRWQPGPLLFVDMNGTTTITNYPAGGTIFIHAGKGNDHVVIDDSVGLHYAVQVFGEEGNDTLLGSIGAELLDGGSGNDFIDAGGGDDQVTGGDGNDDLFGGAGNDMLDGGAGKDNLNGGDGDDVLVGGAGIDHFDGGAGIDHIFAADGGVDFILADAFDVLATLDGHDHIK